MSITFTEPPVVRTGPASSGFHDAAAAALRERPGQWAIIATRRHPTLTQDIRRGTIVAYRPAGSFETCRRVNPDGGFDIYARYVGEASVTPIKRRRSA